MIISQCGWRIILNGRPYRCVGPANHAGAELPNELAHGPWEQIITDQPLWDQFCLYRDDQGRQCMGAPNHRGDHGPWVPSSSLPQQCAAVERRGGTLYRCGKVYGHETFDDDPTHGDWRFVGIVDQGGGSWLGRSVSDLWRDITHKDPHSWKPPDDGDRSVRPKTPGKVPKDVKVTPLGGRQRGSDSVANMDEIVASIDATIEQIMQVKHLYGQAVEAAEQASAAVVQLGGATNPAVISVAGGQVGVAIHSGQEGMASLMGAAASLASWKEIILGSMGG